jgi:hypothetical protein
MAFIYNSGRWPAITRKRLKRLCGAKQPLHAVSYQHAPPRRRDGEGRASIRKAKMTKGRCVQPGRGGFQFSKQQ